MKLTRSLFLLRSCHTVVWPINELLTGCPVNPELSSAGEDTMSDFMSLERQWRNVRIYERTICVSHFFDRVASSHVCRFLVGAWHMLDSVHLRNEGDGSCLITTLAVWSNICSPYAFFFFKLLNMNNSTTSWYIHTYTHKYQCSMYFNILDVLKPTA